MQPESSKSDHPYSHCYRRFVLDMHLADSDPLILSRFDPAAVAETLAQANIQGVQTYTQSHTGMCFWPTRIGRRHPAMGDRDFFGELLRELQSRGIKVFAYYSVVFNNQVIRENPDWRIRSRKGATLEDDYGNHRYGQACPNNAAYYKRTMAEIDELVALRYPYDVMFFDMSFWRLVCMCDSCIARFRRETGLETPTVVDWLDPVWCRYQDARERWTAEFMADLTEHARNGRPDLPVYHNAAGFLKGWHMATPLRAARHSAFLAGDFYGDPMERQLAISLFRNLSRTQPVEFMASICIPSINEHVQLKPLDHLRLSAFTALAHGAAAGFIQCLNPRGDLNSGDFERVGTVFSQLKPYEPFMGGAPLEDVAVYFSGTSRMRFADNGRPVSEVRMGGQPLPHENAARGALGALMEAHIPFGVVSDQNLSDLKRYRAVVLPNVLRMDAEEEEAFRAYVHGGGSLYASAWTSLTCPDGTRHADFRLADVFGCHFAGTADGLMNYFKPAPDWMAKTILPQSLVSHRNDPGAGTTVLKLDRRAEGEVLATRTVPVHAEWGTLQDGRWVSIHSSPPWRDTDEPGIVEHRYGKGRCIYSVADIETVDQEASRKLLLAIIRRLMERPPCLEVKAHPCVIVQAFRPPSSEDLTITLLNAQQNPPFIPVGGVAITLHREALADRKVQSVELLPAGTPLPFTKGADGSVTFNAPELELFQMVRVKCS